MPRRRPPSTIPPKSWTIPIPDDARDTHRSIPYADAEALLVKLGFQKVYETDGIRSTAFQYLRQEPDGSFKKEHDNFATWAHPAGVLVVADSYTPHRGDRTANSVNVYFEVDLGAGRKAAFESGQIYGSGSTNLHDDASYHRPTHTDVINGSYGLMAILKQVQSRGLLLPFDQWSSDVFVHVDTEHYCSWTATPEDDGLSRDELHKKHDALIQQKQDHYLAAIDVMPGLAKLVENNAFERAKIVRDKEWMITEDAVRKAGRILEAGGKRFASDAERATIADWAAHLRMDDATYGSGPGNALAIGPSGVTFPVMLLHSAHNNGNLQRALDLLENCPLPDLERLVTSVDAAGMTLPLYCLERAVDKETIGYIDKADRFPAVEVGKVFEIIARRLGPECIVLDTGRQNALGILGANPDLADRNAERIFPTMERYCQLLGIAKAAGATWNTSPVWEMLEETQSPARGHQVGDRVFHQATHTELLDQLEAGFGAQSDQLTRVRALVHEGLLEESVPTGARGRTARM